MKRPKWLDIVEVRRWLTLRCEHCGHRFRWKRDARHSFGNRDGKVYHQWCIAAIVRGQEAEERLDVLALALDTAGITIDDVQTVAALRAASPYEGSQMRDQVWRAGYALEKRAADRTIGGQS